MVPVNQQTKTVKSWTEWLEWLYDFSKNSVPMKEVCNYDIIFPTDSTCADFEE
jgi:hypothetical protein